MNEHLPPPIIRACSILVDGENPDLLNKLVTEIYTRYREPWRYYHNTNHLNAVLAHVLCFLKLEEPHDVTYDRTAGMIGLAAALFHDAVYLPGAPKGRNEAASCRLMEQYFDGWLANPASDIIMATVDHHQPNDIATPLNNAMAVVIDADLQILRSSPFERRCWREAIYRELNGFNVLGAHLSLEEFNAKSAVWAFDFLASRKRPIFSMHMPGGSRTGKPANVVATEYLNDLAQGKVLLT